MSKRLSWMRPALVLAGLALGMGAATGPRAAAQPGAEVSTKGSPVAPAADAGGKKTRRTELVRPAPGLARGLLPVPRWAVMGVGGALAAAAAGWLVRRIMRRPR